jgi:hypothetical protein
MFYLVHARNLQRRKLGRPSGFCTGVCGEGTWAHEAGESPLLEAVAGKRLVKTRRDGWSLLVGALVICELGWLEVAQ